MYKKFFSRTLFLLSICMLTACTTPTDTNQVTKTPATTSPASAPPVIKPTTPLTTPTVTTPPGPGTNCPASGVVRQATMTSITLGSHQNIVYFDNTQDANQNPATAYLKRYDVTTGSTTTLVSLEHGSIHEATISKDGQWVAFIDQLYDTSTQHFRPAELRVVRIDGQQYQTLFCFASNYWVADYLSWSPNRTQIALVSSPDPNTNPSTLELLNIADGSMRQVLDIGQKPIESFRWLDDQYMYVRFTSMVGDSSLYMLDTQKAGLQQINDLKVIFKQQGSWFCWDAAQSIDGSSLYISQCTERSNSGASGISSGAPSSIGVLPAMGGTLKEIASFQQLAVDQILVITSTTLIFEVNFPTSRDSSDARNGLWKMDIDGTHLVQLTKEATVDRDASNLWSSISRDGALYSYTGEIRNGDGFTRLLTYGAISGGSPVVFAKFDNEGKIVGWTTS